MNGYIEITREAFKTLVDLNTPCDKVEQKESYCKLYYIAHGIRLMQVDNYNSFCTQYYIQDVNA